MKLLISIPAYNEGECIARVIASVREKAPEDDFVIINDGSKDNTLAVCRDLGCPVLNLPINLGLSGAFGCAMRYAEEKGYDAVIQIDGDSQHDPGSIRDLKAEMERTGCDVVIGSRYVDAPPSLSSLRGVGSRLINALIRLKTGKEIHDPTSGMRLYNRKVIGMFVKNDFLEPEPHTMAYLLKKGCELREITAVMHERETGTSYLTGLKTVRYMLRVCLSILLV